MSSKTRSRLLLNSPLQPGIAINGRQHTIALAFEAVLQGRAHGRFIFDNQDTAASFCFHIQVSSFALGLSGSSIVNRLPCPTALRTMTRPPCADMVCLTMVSPMPMPCVSRRNSEPRR